MENEYWKDTPFGENSMFHSKFDEKQRQLRLQEQPKGEIDEIYVYEEDLIAKEQKKQIKYDNLAPTRYNQTNTSLPQNVDYEIATVTVAITIKGNAESVYITMGQTQRAINLENEYIAVFHLKIPKDNKKLFKITAQTRYFTGNNVIHSKTKIATINSKGKVLELKGEECICKRDLTVEDVKYIVKALRENTFYKAKNPVTQKEQDYPLNNLLYMSVDKIFHRNKFSGKYSNEEVTNNSFENFTTQLNNIFKKYDINSCKRKAHFLAQSFIETKYFTKTIEGDNEYTKNYDPYRGRGFLHLSLDVNYKKYQKFSQYNVFENYSLVAKNLEIAADSAGWYWQFGSVDGDINKIADTQTVKEVTHAINPALFALEKRKKASDILINIFSDKEC